MVTGRRDPLGWWKEDGGKYGSRGKANAVRCNSYYITKNGDFTSFQWEEGKPGKDHLASVGISELDIIYSSKIHTTCARTVLYVGME